MGNGLAVIRKAYEEQYELVERIQFQPPWAPSNLIITFDAEVWLSAREGQYTAWDDLNEEYGVTDIDISQIGGYVALSFEGIMHPKRLREAYRDLPGIRSISLNWYAGGGEHVYPRSLDGTISYLFQSGGELAAQPVEYLYFAFDGESSKLVGAWTLANPLPSSDSFISVNRRRFRFSGATTRFMAQKSRSDA